AAILRRGVGVIQVPTTLLAQVDSAVGGKTGINVAQGKNLVGAFHQPRRVIVDLSTIATLPDRQRRAGYAEIVKYGLIDRPQFFAWLEAHGADVLAGESGALAHAIAESCRAKASVVAADERETGRRALLNLGHSFGHALEAALGYDGRLLHGEAVAIGVVLAAELSVALGHADATECERIAAHLRSAGLTTSITELDAGITPERLMALMAQDKKVRDGRLQFVLLRGIGRAFLSDNVPRELLQGVLAHSCAGTGTIAGD
ncbi:MAG: 3-dehydroquinate synthase, partial [Alphaproteobacteria bacterium]